MWSARRKEESDTKLHAHARNLTNFLVIRIFSIHVCKLMTLFDGQANATELIGRGRSARLGQ